MNGPTPLRKGCGCTAVWSVALTGDPPAGLPPAPAPTCIASSASRQFSSLSVPGKKTAARLHHQVPRGDWYRMTCPRCHAEPGKLCHNDDRVGPSEKRQLPHDERLRRVLQSDDRIGPGEKAEGRPQRTPAAGRRRRAPAACPGRTQASPAAQERAGNTGTRNLGGADLACERGHLPKVRGRPALPVRAPRSAPGAGGVGEGVHPQTVGLRYPPLRRRVSGCTLLRDKSRRANGRSTQPTAASTPARKSRAANGT
ncbi:hypothetical protein QF037_000168 [Streptomyces canus]|uniref:zinc finger domain-containing protein n=1 Tax=Streptomyces canus TaxID=58343 RepID=UPI00278248FE|nr:hypothetical protein [Streptomyces canus]